MVSNKGISVEMDYRNIDNSFKPKETTFRILQGGG
jgi:hypothetical protein